MKKIFMFFYLLGLMSAHTFAADITLDELQTQYGVKNMVALTGKINPGDLATFKNAVRGDPNIPPDSYDPGVPRILHLSGNSDDYGTSIQIAKIVNENLIRTYILPNQSCENACAIIFMAGRQPDGDGFTAPSRCLKENSKVVFGTPDIAQSILVEAKGSGLSRQTRIETLKFVIDLVRLADEHEWPRGLLDAVLNTDETLLLTPDQELFVGEGFYSLGTYKKKTGGC